MLSKLRQGCWPDGYLPEGPVPLRCRVAQCGALPFRPSLTTLQYGCPGSSALQSLGLEDEVGDTSVNGKWLFGLVVVLSVCACGGYFFSKRGSAIGGYASL
eukprot:TRINITY_DN2750_c0_g1_i2.p2 TRINITY_DN2750_c0_g1~~TRINITY_DN2750_c0_g1_i2.p2  ORF type:complete len:101 (-),score=1.93 TRINITY_DN2750_c0_g1_i2:81-383(-)